jgi:hypothetical protein
LLAPRPPPALARGVPVSGGGPRDAPTSGAPLVAVPSPAPGGVAPGATASGFGLSIFVLAGLLVLGAPPARRRLRLSSEPWRVAPFVLLPERPG